MSGPADAPIVISSSPSSSDDSKCGAPYHGSGLCSRLRSSKKKENSEHEEEEEGGQEEAKSGFGDEKGKGEEANGLLKGEEANGLGKRSPPPTTSATVFPKRRVKFLMTECEECRSSHESIFLVNKAVQLFLEAFASDVYRKGHKTVTYRNLSSVVSAKKKYEFLSDYVPEKIKAEDALNARASLE